MLGLSILHALLIGDHVCSIAKWLLNIEPHASLSQAPSISPNASFLDSQVLGPGRSIENIIVPIIQMSKLRLQLNDQYYPLSNTLYG